MRKDTRLGVAVGGVFIAVALAYVAVSGRSTTDKKKVVLTGKNPTTQTPAAAPDPTDAAQPPADSGTGANPAGETQPPVTVAGGAETTGAAPAKPAGATNWERLLGTTNSEPVVQTTSDGGSAAPVRTRTPEADTGGSKAKSTGKASPAPADGGPVIVGTSTDKPATRPSSSSPDGASAGGTTHRVAANETFTSIAKTYYGDARLYTLVQKANPSVNPNKLRPGTVITLPARSAVHESTTASPSTPASGSGVKKSPRPAGKTADPAHEYVVQPSDSLYHISEKLYGRGDKADALYEINKDVIGGNPGRLKVGMVLKLPQPPTQTVVTRYI